MNEVQKNALWIKPQLDARGIKACIIGTRVNQLIVNRLIEGALEALERHGADVTKQTVILAPGALEMPTIAKQACLGQFHMLVIVGAVIKGSTDHYEQVAAGITQGISRLAYETGTPIGNGVLTVHSLEQALERAGAQMGNMGYQAALAALEVHQVLAQLKSLKQNL